MNLEDLAKSIKEKDLANMNIAKTVIKGVFAAIAESLERGEPTTITGFGVFRPKIRAASSRFVPLAGRVVDTPERVTAVFKPCKGLKARLNQ